MFWHLPIGEDTDRRGSDVRVVELNTRSSRVRVYYIRSTAPVQESNVICLLAHRGHMGFTKQSRLTTDTRRGEWRESFNTAIDLSMMRWSDIIERTNVFGEVDIRQRHHCADVLGRRLRYSGFAAESEKLTIRTSGTHPKKTNVLINNVASEIIAGRGNWRICMDWMQLVGELSRCLSHYRHSNP